jgi:DNA-binding MarR family transcriptional regulator
MTSKLRSGTKSLIAELGGQRGSSLQLADAVGAEAHRRVGARKGSKHHELDLLADSLGYCLKRAQVRAYEVLATFVDADSISPARMTALSLIAMRSGISQSALAKELGINRASVVKVIDSLEAKQLVERRATEGDRRSYSLALTDSGLDELRGLQEQVRRYEQAIAAGLSADERHQLMRLLERVAVAHQCESEEQDDEV